MNILIKIDTQKITHLEILEGSNEWYWGTDYFHGDLYEAEELFKSGHEITSNKLLFVKYPKGQVIEPIKPKNGQYFGRPIYHEDAVIILLVNFIDSTINLIKYMDDFKVSTIVTTIPLDEITDCYNLYMIQSPLMLARNGHNQIFDLIYPKKLSFEISNRESFDYIDNDKMYFSIWYEDPEYREEVVVRELSTGKIIETYAGVIETMPNGEKWLLV